MPPIDPGKDEDERGASPRWRRARARRLRAPPALLVPGYTGSKEDFLAVLESLAGRTAVVAIDLRGQYQCAPAADRAGYGPTSSPPT